jgi:hypothetical protein
LLFLLCAIFRSIILIIFASNLLFIFLWFHQLIVWVQVYLALYLQTIKLRCDSLVMIEDIGELSSFFANIYVRRLAHVTISSTVRELYSRLLKQYLTIQIFQILRRSALMVWVLKRMLNSGWWIHACVARVVWLAVLLISWHVKGC